MQTPLRIIGLLICALALAACGSATRLAYGQADDLLYWWMDGYVNFNGDQSPRVREDVAGLLQWHRSTQLPQYAALLARLQGMAGQDIKTEQACTVADELRTKFNAVTVQAEAPASALAMVLTSEQIDHMQRKFEKNNEAFEREWRKRTPEERRARRIKQARERSEMLYGKLEAAQMLALTATVDESKFDMEASHTERLRRQQDMLQTLRKINLEKPAQAQTTALLRSLMERNLSSPNPAYRNRAEGMWRETCTSFAKVHNSTSAAQRTKAVEVLKGYEADFRVLAGKKG